MSGFEGREAISMLEGLKHPHKDCKKPSMERVYLRMPLAFTAVHMMWGPTAGCGLLSSFRKSRADFKGAKTFWVHQRPIFNSEWVGGIKFTFFEKEREKSTRRFWKATSLINTALSK